MEDLILSGGGIITCDRMASQPEARAIVDGRVAAAGDLDAVRSAAGPSARSIDLDGATVLPGLIDTHPHLMHFGIFAEPLVDLADATDHDDIVRRIATKSAETDAGEWVMATPVGEAHYFIRRSWRDLCENVLPGREVLDRATVEHPVMIQAWAPTTPNVMALNSAGLSALGITAELPDRVGGVTIHKDAAGEPTGLLSGAVNNYYSNEPFTETMMGKVPLLDPGAIGPGTERAMRAYNGLGVTTVYEGHSMDFPLIAAYGWLRGEDRLSVRVLCCPEAEPYGLPWNEQLSDDEFLERLEGAAGLVQRTDEMLRIDGVTIGRGGPCGPGFILMREPYEGPFGEPTTGVSFMSQERAEVAMHFARDRGVRLNIVTAGTAEHDAHFESLETLAAGEMLAADGRAWLLQHLYFFEPGHAERAAALGLDATTSMSFSWGKGELVRERMGEDPLADLIPLRRLLDAGLHVGCGTDWGPKNVFEHIALAVEPTYAGSGAPASTPGITREEALAMWTRDAAHVLRWEGIGSLEPGNHADLCVVDRDPLRCPLDDLAGTEVLATMLGGELVHGELAGL